MPPSSELAERLRDEPSRRGLRDRFEDMKVRRRELERDGMTRGESWRQAASEFAPDVGLDWAGPTPSETVEEFAVDHAWGSFNMLEDVTFAYLNAGLDAVDLESAPSSGAIWMLAFARACPSRFCKDFIAPLVRRMDLSKAVGDFRDDGTDQINWLDSLDRALGGDNVGDSGIEGG
jgi:hypothetical protein